jgi:tetratricopeptide (TPR) repeat protein
MPLCILSTSIGEQGNYENAIKLLKKAHKNEIELGYGEPPLYARPVAMSLAKAHGKVGKVEKAIEKYNELLKRFPKSAMVYNELLKNHKQKGDVEKTKEMESKLKEASLYADKEM